MSRMSFIRSILRIHVTFDFKSLAEDSTEEVDSSLQFLAMSFKAQKLWIVSARVSRVVHSLQQASAALSPGW